MTFPFQAAAATDRGLVRRTNQDRFGLDEELGLFVVCDGMGGAAGGEVASNLAVEAFLLSTTVAVRQCATPSAACYEQALADGAHLANEAVRERADEEVRYRGMGTTLVAAHLWQDRLTLLNVGDSRAYLFRQGAGRQLTQDHSYVAEQVRSGQMTEAEAEVSSMQSLITRAVGAEEDVRPDVFTETLESGDVILLTTDGLTRHVALQGLADAIAQSASFPLHATVRHLIELALARGGSDNITCILIRAGTAA